MQLVTPGIGLIFWMTLSFGIVFFLLRKFAWKPILSMIDERSANIEKALKAAEMAKEDLKLFQTQNEKLQAEARAERDAMLREAREMRERMVQEARDKANAEAGKVLAAAQQEILSQKNAALNEIKTQVAMISVEIAEKILKSELSSDDKQKTYMKSLMDEIKLN